MIFESEFELVDAESHQRTVADLWAEKPAKEETKLNPFFPLVGYLSSDPFFQAEIPLCRM